MDHTLQTRYYMTHTTNWDGDCCFMKIYRTTFIAWIFSLTSISYNFWSSMLNFKPIRWSCNHFFFSSNYFTQSLISLETSCLRFAIVSTMVILSLDNGSPISVVAHLPNFPLHFPQPKVHVSNETFHWNLISHIWTCWQYLNVEFFFS
jgi:hypothetical protein